VLYNVSQDFECAVESFTNATKTNSSDYTIYNKIGATLANGNRSLEAIPAYAKALEMRPRYARGWLNLGISYANINKYNEAAKAYLQALYLNPEANHIWNYLRVVFTCMQRLDLVQETGQTLQGLSNDALKQHIKKVLSQIDVGYELIE
jgi:peroxin-5